MDSLQSLLSTSSSFNDEQLTLPINAKDSKLTQQSEASFLMNCFNVSIEKSVDYHDESFASPFINMDLDGLLEEFEERQSSQKSTESSNSNQHNCSTGSNESNTFIDWPDEDDWSGGEGNGCNKSVNQLIPYPSIDEDMMEVVQEPRKSMKRKSDEDDGYQRLAWKWWCGS